MASEKKSTDKVTDPVPPHAGISQEDWELLPVGSPRRYDLRTYSELKARDAQAIEAIETAAAATANVTIEQPPTTDLNTGGDGTPGNTPQV